ncbi:hypothetical protein BS50DRAFT_619081 [Corynespora cassiicola Philippines]|uniref:Mid2 domain-containing protein n=1 Tax=Corynespora cassiicola Philippines TaxID=1448308 RepID=A0A2T2NXU0_CORCC|nr:hypothetical protein BS50DRAFT_619081 [Corynespora cassiicola Philippines]
MNAIIRLSTVFAFSSSVLAQCYFPNGGEAGSDTACNPNSLVSACCYDGQACLSNGLCVSDPHNETLARLHRGTCTDKNWKSGNCPRQCLDIDNNGVPVYSCNSTGVDSYCCFDNCECSSRWETFSFAEAEPYTITIIGESYTQTHQSTSSAASSTATSAGTTDTTSSMASATVATFASVTSTPSATAASDTESNSSSSTAIGVGVGVGVGAAAIIGAAGFFFWRRRKNRPAPYAGDGTATKPAEIDTEYCPPATKYAYYAEADCDDAHRHYQPILATSEMPATPHEPIELPTSPPVHKTQHPK